MTLCYRPAEPSQGSTALQSPSLMADLPPGSIEARELGPVAAAPPHRQALRPADSTTSVAAWGLF